MTATDELRRLLDEREVEYREHRYSGQSVTTIWRAGCEFHYRENRPGETRLHADGIAPEQAIEATLGGDLKAENDRLRELVRELWNCALQYHRFDIYRHEIGVDGCGIGCTANGEGCCACKLEQRMRELGVEV